MKIWHFYSKAVSLLVKVLMGLAGAGVIVMMLVTVCDVVMRRFGMPVPGAVDIVQIAACVCAVCALPYTTAVKGHVAVEFFFQHLPGPAKVLVDSTWRMAVIILYSIMSWRSLIYGQTLLRRNSVTLTLQIPMFWVLWLMSLSFAVVALVKFYNLAHPGKEMMKP